VITGRMVWSSRSALRSPASGSIGTSTEGLLWAGHAGDGWKWDEPLAGHWYNAKQPKQRARPICPSRKRRCSV